MGTQSLEDLWQYGRWFVCFGRVLGSYGDRVTKALRWEDNVRMKASLTADKQPIGDPTFVRRHVEGGAQFASHGCIVRVCGGLAKEQRVSYEIEWEGVHGGGGAMSRAAVKRRKF